jgi:hypothetical protein
MKIMKNLSIIFLFFAFAMPVSSLAQCKGFTKKKCAPLLEDYIPAENYNSLQMFDGEEAELHLVFVENNDYRIAICSHPILGDINYEIKTEQGELVYSNADNKDNKIFDFSTTSTEKLSVIISIPKSESSTGMVQPGCVSIMVGHKPSA